MMVTPLMVIGVIYYSASLKPNILLHNIDIITTVNLTTLTLHQFRNKLSSI